MASTSRVLAVGSINGNFKSTFVKVSNINKKHGPFDFVLCVGNLFGESEEDEELQELLDGKIEVPATAYFVFGTRAFPAKVVERLKTSPEICRNLIFLGKHNSFKTLSSLKLVTCGGAFDLQHFASSTVHAEDLTLPYMEPTPFSKLLSTTSECDILISSSFPTSIGTNSFKLPSLLPVGSQPITELLAKCKPKYHFVGGEGLFWEREPFSWSEENIRVTRFLSLADAGNPEKHRWFYAFQISSGGTSVQTIPVGATDCPFGMHRAQKRKHDDLSVTPNFIFENGHSKRQRHSDPPLHYVCRNCKIPGHWIEDCPHRKDRTDRDPNIPPDSYVCKICNVKGHWIRDCPVKKEQDRTGNRNAPRNAPRIKEEIGPDHCWFCLSNPHLNKHLITSIGNEVYLTLAKGQIIDTNGSIIPGGGHILIIPIGHYQTSKSLPDDIKESASEEIEKYKKSLQTFYAKYDHNMVVWEVSRSTGRASHFFLSVCPIPNALVDKVEDAFIAAAGQAGFSFESDEELASRRVEDSKDFFKVDLPNGKTLVHLLQSHGGPMFNLQFGRLVLAKVLGDEERVDWRACQVTEEEETRDATEFKEAFKDYDPSLIIE